MIHNEKAERLNWWQEIIIIYWFIWNQNKLNEYVYWVEAGMLRQYAFEKAKQL